MKTDTKHIDMMLALYPELTIKELKKGIPAQDDRRQKYEQVFSKLKTKPKR